ncbi:zf-HC2 domain-containing protein [Streptomyces sp. HNM0663]|uniref:Zf-HC2 domain-containing protein n=1 Tax=Streptomyces chengmaiensis TaxID=3040919 RepID=A0ABT6HTR3_9ACTN|nr:zf-HC2 domain-containing protein [Streptomyces chengmaiensis]MDH2391696.1 zf-HC2 domain-containing protein [Streptomyces chengmaiensis]
MTMRQHDDELLGAYVLGVLDEADAGALQTHLADCERCRKELAELREMEAALGEVPEEAFLDGPPPGGDLLLQRTMRQMRAERTGVAQRRWAVAGLAAAASLAAVFWLGTRTGDDGPANVARPPVPTGTGSATAPATPPPGVKAASATDPVTGVRMAVEITPAAAWVRVNASVSGIPSGERCRLIVVSKDGVRTTAGGWVVGAHENGAGKGVNLDGSAAVAPSDIREVVVENEAGTHYVSVPV